MKLLNSSGALINTARLEMLVGYEREEKDLVPLNIPTTPTPSYMSIYMAAFKNYGATTSTTLTKVWLET